MKDTEFKSLLSKLNRIVREVSGKIPEERVINLITLSAKAELKLKQSSREGYENIKNEIKKEIGREDLQ